MRPDDRIDGGTLRHTILKQNRRVFLGTAIGGSLALANAVHAQGNDTIRIGLIGCGGRGSGAAVQALKADANTQLVAMGDAFEDRLKTSLESIQSTEVGRQVDVVKERQFIGLDAYKRVLETDVDVVILATPPGFRPLHIAAAVEARKHIFAEKPVAVDATGVRSVLESTKGDSGLAPHVEPQCRRYPAVLARDLDRAVYSHVPGTAPRIVDDQTPFGRQPTSSLREPASR